jgi:hypothetical protein
VALLVTRSRLIVLLLTGLLLGGVAAPAAYAQIAPGDLDAKLFSSVQPFVGDPSRTFVTEVTRNSGSELLAKFFQADASGSVPSRRLITQTTVSLADRTVPSDFGMFRQDQQQCFVAFLRGGSVEVKAFGEEDPNAADSGGFDADSGRFCAAREEEADVVPGAEGIPLRSYFVGRLGSGSTSRTFGRPLYKPRTVRTRPGVLVVRVKWDRWGRATTTGRGTVRVNRRGFYSRSIYRRRDFRRVRGAHVRLSARVRGLCRGRPAVFYTRAQVTYPRGSRLARRQSIRLAPTCTRG